MASLLTPEEQTFVNLCRVKALDKTITLEEMKRAIVILKGSRTKSAEASAASGAKKKSKAPSIESVSSSLADLENF
jgi:hypothetical protein